MNDEPTLSGLAIERAHQSLGQTLRAARLAQNIELADIAATTRVPLRHLEAIEADDHDSLPALPYTIGFVKTLANAVGVDPVAAGAQYRAETSKVPHAPVHVPIEAVDESRVPPRWLVAASVALIVVILGVFWAYSEGAFDSSTPAAPVVAAAPVPEPLPAVTQPAPVAAQPADAVPTDTTQAAPEAAPADGVVAPETAPDSAATTGPPIPGGPVVITATDEAWFKVYDKSTRQSVKMGILKPGERYVVPADRDDLLLWTGKAGALRISVAGKTLPALGGPQDMVKDVALTPSALLARSGG